MNPYLPRIFFKDTSNCDVEYGCLKNPSNCQNSNCDYLIKWKKLDADWVEFVMNTKSDTNSWLGIGFANKKKMVTYINFF